MHRMSWWVVAVVVAFAALVVWLGGTWLFHAFIRLHGGQ